MAYLNPQRGKDYNNWWYAKAKLERPFHLRCRTLKAKAKGQALPFNLTEDYLESIWTGYCEGLGVKIDLHGDRKDEYHAELDRVVPLEGYVKGNVAWVSRRFNRLKGDG